MREFDPSNPDPYKRMGWALRNYWWAIIPSVLGIIVLEELSRERWGANGKTLVQAGLLVFMLGALVYDRRFKRQKAEAERERQ